MIVILEKNDVSFKDFFPRSCSMPTVNIHDQNSIRGYIQTVLFEAGQFLNAQGVAAAALNPEAFEKARESKSISADYRPTVINLFNIVDNGSVGFFSSKNITLFSSLFDFSSKAPSTHEEQRMTPEEQEKKKKEKEARQNALFGSIAALIAALLSGFTYDEYSTQTKTLGKTQQIYKDSEYLSGSIQKNFQKLVSKQLKIDQMRTAKATHYFYASLLGLGGAAAWAFGGYTTTPQVSSLGKVASVVAAAWALFNLARHWRDDQKIKKLCEEIAGDGRTMGWAQTILTYDLPYYLNNMTPAPPPAPSFASAEVDGESAPLYPQLSSMSLPRPEGFVPIQGVAPAPSAPPL
jgi:hypothetical protein